MPKLHLPPSVQVFPVLLSFVLLPLVTGPACAGMLDGDGDPSLPGIKTLILGGALLLGGFLLFRGFGGAAASGGLMGSLGTAVKGLFSLKGLLIGGAVVGGALLFKNVYTSRTQPSGVLFGRYDRTLGERYKNPAYWGDQIPTSIISQASLKSGGNGVPTYTNPYQGVGGTAAFPNGSLVSASGIASAGTGAGQALGYRGGGATSASMIAPATGMMTSASMMSPGMNTMGMNGSGMSPPGLMDELKMFVTGGSYVPPSMLMSGNMGAGMVPGMGGVNPAMMGGVHPMQIAGNNPAFGMDPVNNQHVLFGGNNLLTDSPMGLVAPEFSGPVDSLGRAVIGADSQSNFNRISMHVASQPDSTAAPAEKLDEAKTDKDAAYNELLAALSSAGANDLKARFDGYQSSDQQVRQLSGQ